jgi:hypothetical protein
MLQPDPLAAALYAAFVVTLTNAGEAWLEQAVADQRLETLGEFALHANDLTYRRRQIIVDAAAWNSPQVSKGAHVTVEKGDGVAALVQPDELAPRVHQPQQERLVPLAVQFHGDFKEVDLDFVAKPQYGE